MQTFISRWFDVGFWSILKYVGLKVWQEATFTGDHTLLGQLQRLTAAAFDHSLWPPPLLQKYLLYSAPTCKAANNAQLFKRRISHLLTRALDHLLQHSPSYYPRVGINASIAILRITRVGYPPFEGALHCSCFRPHFPTDQNFHLQFRRRGELPTKLPPLNTISTIQSDS